MKKNSSMSSSDQEMRFKGAAVSDGIAIGTLFFLPSLVEDIPEFPIKLGEVDAEIARYRDAVFSSREDLKRLRGDLAEKGDTDDVVSFLDTHIHMLDDPLITIEMEDNIRQRLKNTESVFRSVIRDYEQKLSARSNSFFEQRLVDVRDVSSRILGHLLDGPLSFFSEAPPGSVLFAKELSPTHTIVADPEQIVAFVSETGGGNSHAALIARSKGIPYISNIALAPFEDMSMCPVIVDGLNGELILNPSEKTLKQFRKKQNELKKRSAKYVKDSKLTAETSDGFAVKLLANVGASQDLDYFPDACEGVGLFRTEYLLLSAKRAFPSEEEQRVAYRTQIEKCRGKPIVIRVFDLGGDKNPKLNMEKELSCALGCRGIRFLLRHPDIFTQQLRAIFRASSGADVRLLLPLVSDVSELILAKELIAEVCAQLGVQPLPIGSMIEVPSAVMTCETIARHSDFLSIGTNDLVQYTLGVDRTHSTMSDLLLPAHPSIIRMIKMVSVVARRLNKSLTICGEIASNPLFIPLLLGLGIKEFSCAPRYLPIIKETIRNWSIVEAFAFAERILRIEDPREVIPFIKNSLAFELL